ncbi:helix-turn-helix domain-containing protein [Desulfovibrio sp. OttesenSCG-928-A18]|nr:helix-turn-helix domain-containing protein [Desulfovibrio sp. OttesenSCG-928-A18]
MGRPVTTPGGTTPTARIRAAKGWSQKKMAEEFGVDRGTISRWERGESEPPGPAKILMDKYLAEITEGA